MPDDIEKKKAAPGWYAHPTMAHTRRYWDGGSWTSHISPAEVRSKQMHKPVSPATYIALGFLLGLVGGGLLVFGIVEDLVGFVFAASFIISLSSIVSGVGVIAAGVRFGMEHADYDRQQRATK